MASEKKAPRGAQAPAGCSEAAACDLWPHCRQRTQTGTWGKREGRSVCEVFASCVGFEILLRRRCRMFLALAIQFHVAILLQGRL